ncbi:PhzF family phenazine biosynthesis protein [Balneola sp. MJW-20]|uniref:PhzF family phenazine biosynthesis protein n=1 Tax=Gracilimonas aurantiaca TaxID=3234185 RepID=UPI003465D8B9
MKLPIYQVDAFTDHRFGGNPAAVCPLEKWPSDKEMQNIAAENNLSETAFFKQTGDSFHLRWFTPSTEVELCGHATLATAHVLFNEMGYSKEEIAFDTLSGRLTVKRSGYGLTMNFPVSVVEKVHAPAILFEALGLPPMEENVYKSDDYLIELGSEQEVVDLNPDFRLLKEVDARGVIVTAPGDEVDFVSRFFAPQSGVDEDPVTGSAHTKSAPYWAKKLDKNELKARQVSHRAGELHCVVKGDRVEISGKVITFMRGEIEIA